MVKQSPDGFVEFAFFRPQAASVSLAGEFNDWQAGSLRMNRANDGWWRCWLQLAPGYYQFRYFADGQWYTDYAAFGVEPTPNGFNSVLRVEAVAAETAPADGRIDKTLQAA